MANSKSFENPDGVSSKMDKLRFRPEMFRSLSDEVGKPLIRSENNRNTVHDKLLNYHSGISNISNNEEGTKVKEAFAADLTLLDKFEKRPSLKLKNKKDYEIVKSRVLGSLEKHEGSKDSSRRTYANYVDVLRDENISAQIVAAGGDIASWRAKRMNLEKEYVSCGISYKEYIIERDQINAEAIEASSDEDLKELWKEYEEDSESKDYLVGQYNDSKETDNGEIVVEDEKTANDALDGTKINSSDFEIEITADGKATVKTENDFTVDILVCQDQGGDFVYYLSDRYSGEPVRVMSEDLIDSIDDRQLDAYLSSEITPHIGDEESISDIPDETIVNVAKGLIGDGLGRGYKIDGDNRLVLDNLVKLLLVKDVEYASLEKKIGFLGNFLTTDQNKDSLRRFLLNYTDEIEKRGEVQISGLEEVLG
ncbi:MAG: hypothetical protein O3B47_02215 [bacterium]|nr:hypothetical protein [bacterium]